MKIYRIFSLVLVAILFAFESNAQLFDGWEHLFQPKQEYVVYSVSDEINVDGKPDELSWKNADWTNDFVDIEGNGKATPKFRTRVKMLWDKQNLYLLAELEEPDIWAYYDKKDMVVFHENDFELFIDPERNNYEYFELEINAQNILFDLLMTKPYRDGGTPMISWDTEGIKKAVSVEGTLNTPGDVDKKWVVEMAIPFSALRQGVDTQIPDDNSYWNIDFSRVEWQTELVDGKYVRKNDANGKRLPEDNWVWSPIGVINMHYPERWGIIQFSEIEAGSGKVDFKKPEEDKYSDYLWLLYYKQRAFQKKNEVFAKTLADINFPENPEPDVKVTMQANDKQFFAELTTDNGWWFYIDHKGEIHKKKKE